MYELRNHFAGRRSAAFSIILAIAAVIGVTIYGETGRKRENPQAMFIGLGIGGMFLLIALMPEPL